jgi:putative transcriptional regulator
MPIIVRLDRVMVDRKVKLIDLADKVGITYANLSNLKNGNVSAVRFSTLEKICEILNCQPGDILEYKQE